MGQEAQEPEPWLRGPLAGVAPHAMPVFFSLTQVREDLARHTAGIAESDVWRTVAGKHSLGYHLKHMAGSVDRLSTYLEGGHLDGAQLEFLANEHTPAGTLDELLQAVEVSLGRSEERVRAVRLETLFDTRAVGRQQLATTVNGLLVHLCEHTQRHLGQAILIAKLLRAD